MATPRPEYELTEAADEDLLAIARYTIKTWSIEQARRYEAALERYFRAIGHGKVRRRVFSAKRPDLFFTHCEHHYVFYLVREDDCPLIVAVLHEKMTRCSNQKEAAKNDRRQSTSRTRPQGEIMNQSDETRPLAFDPAAHGFVLLPDHRPPGGVRFFEFRNDACVDGTPDYRRLNLYLSQDGGFVTIWWGCLGSVAIGALFRDHGLAPADYDEPLFRGYIDSDEQARHILKALRPGGRLPQVLRVDSIRGIVCESLEEKTCG